MCSLQARGPCESRTHVQTYALPLTAPAPQGYLSMSVMWQAQTDGMRQAIKYAAFLLPVVITGAVWSVPAAMCYYWTCSNIYSTAADLAFRVPSGAWRCLLSDRGAAACTPLSCLRRSSAGATELCQHSTMVGCASVALPWIKGSVPLHGVRCLVGRQGVCLPRT